MRKTLATIVLCLLALSALGAHHADALLTAVVPAAQPAPRSGDVYSSAAALRHRAAQAPHWIAQVLVPRQ